MTKKTYEALPGVEWVNGQRVPTDRSIKLSAVEAKFDLAQGRIRLKDQDMPAQPAIEEKGRREQKPERSPAKD